MPGQSKEQLNAGQTLIKGTTSPPLPPFSVMSVSDILRDNHKDHPSPPPIESGVSENGHHGLSLHTMTAPDQQVSETVWLWDCVRERCHVVSLPWAA